jgi:hypothetical protein
MTPPGNDPNHIAPAAQRELGPLNATVLLSGTVVGTVTTLVTYLFGASLPGAVPLACAAG